MAIVQGEWELPVMLEVCSGFCGSSAGKLRKLPGHHFFFHGYNGHTISAIYRREESWLVYIIFWKYAKHLGFNSPCKRRSLMIKEVGDVYWEDAAVKAALTQSKVTLTSPRLISYSEVPDWGCWPPGEISADIPAGLGVEGISWGGSKKSLKYATLHRKHPQSITRPAVSTAEALM